MAQPFDLGRLSTSGDPSAIAERISEFTVSGNRTLVLTPSTSAQTHLVWVDRAGKQISEAAPPADYGFVDLSRDGKRVAFDGMANSRFEVWLRDLERDIASRLTFQPSNVPLWSPDGGTVVFASIGNGLDLSQRPSNMSAPEAVLLKLNAPPFLFPSDWSSDGRYLAYFRTDPKTRLDQWVLPMFGDRQPLAFLHGDFNESQGQFSPDDKWMAYVSDESGTPQINVVSFPTPAGIRQVSTAGGSQPRWRRDGKELFYIALDHKLMAVSVKTGATFEAETPHPLFETTLPTTPLRQAYSVSPDGQRFLLTSPLGVSSAPLTLIQNWTAGLRK
jgi:dipeptidyl aminopeptidase/acylaminoacyl peptidase